VKAPEVGCRFQKFELDITFYIWRIPGIGHTANNIASLWIGKYDGLPRQKITCEAKNGAIVENNDCAGYFPGRFRVT